MTTRNDIQRVLWSACDSFRGKIDSSRYKDYILSMLFVKYLKRAMSRERFTLDSESTFDYLYEKRNDTEIGQKINVALSHIEEHNSGKLRNVFRAIDFNSQVDFGDVKEKNATLITFALSWVGKKNKKALDKAAKNCEKSSEKTYQPIRMLIPSMLQLATINIFLRPSSFASQSFLCFADILICQTIIFYTHTRMLSRCKIKTHETCDSPHCLMG